MATTTRKPTARKSTATATTAVPNMPAAAFGQGVTVAVADGVCTITFAVGADYGPSSTGKTRVVAKAGYGESVKLPDGSRVQMMCYRKVAS
jgi:ferric-dicitrate binding protein FerR (iron transport regulator)